MAVYLSPGVFPREIDLSVLPTAIGPLRPAFIGTAKKGPMNQAVFIANSQMAVDTFGQPFPESYLMYAVLAYLEEGNQCYIMRIGVECEAGQPEALDAICVDTSGARSNGWGRIPVFTGIDYGRINLREIGDGIGENAAPITFHDASTGTPRYNDVNITNTSGDPTDATLTITGTYTGSVDDSFIMIILSAPTTGPLDGAGYQIIRNSDGATVAQSALVDAGGGVSTSISIGTGLSISVVVASGDLDENDTFSFEVVTNNRVFSVAVEGDATPTEYTMPATTYTTVGAFVDAANLLLAGEDYLFVSTTLADESVIPQIRTTIAGNRIQTMSTPAWALALGSQQYAWDIPRSYLLGIDTGPYNITTQNNRVKIQVIQENTTTTVEFNVPIGLGQTAASIANSLDAAGIVAGEVLWDSFSMMVPDVGVGGIEHVFIVTSTNYRLSELYVQANYSNLKTLRFVEELNIPYPYKRAYRGFTDSRLVLPASGENDASIPLSCEIDPTGDECASDTAYFGSIVGWLVAPTSGTWIDAYTVSLEVYTAGLGDAASKYKLTVYDSNRQVLEAVDGITFDKREARYIGNVLNPGTAIGGTLGNSYANWDERPAFLENDPNAADFVVRQPSQFYAHVFNGQANGVPLDPAYSSELDAAVIGNPSTSTGLYAFQNPETIDINLLATPGFSTGAVIGTALQICESRGDVLYLVDPPFGLRPQQVVDWHNGILLDNMNSAVNSSYGALYWGWVRIFDQFSGDEIWIPPSGHITAVFSRTSRDSEQWFAPAGLRRGRLLTALDVEYSPAQGERDLLYGSGNAVNPIVKFPQDGITVWGQRTLQRTQSALDRVNVRMLLIFIKKNLTRTLRTFIFEPNDRVLWRQVAATVEPFLADIQVRRGLQGFRVIVDETNNTPERIDRNELWVSVFLKPTRTVEFVVLNLVVMRTGASFAAEEVLAAGGIISGGN